MRSKLLSFLLTLSTFYTSSILVTGTPLGSSNAVSLIQRDELSARTTLEKFKGCSTKDRKEINQALKDAVMIVKGMGNPDEINWDHLFTKDYFGPPSENKQYQNNIKNNIKRAQAVAGHWDMGDRWYDRFWTITCNDPGDKDGPRCNLPHRPVAYHVDVNDPKLKNAHPVINLCRRFFDDLRPTGEVVDDINQGRFCCPKDTTLSMKSQGSHFLHEMFHTKYTGKFSDGMGAGISSPQCIDYEVIGYPGLAYTPARAKWLAKAQLGGAGVVYKNVDNYVYFAIGMYMWRKWKEVPWLPKAKWDPNNSKKQPSRRLLAAREEEAPDDIDYSTANTQSVKPTGLKSDMEMYGSNEPIQCVDADDNEPSTTQAYAAGRIKEFCDPKNSAGSPHLDAQYDYWPVGWAAGETAPWTSNGLWMSVSWNPKPECEGKSLVLEQENCERIMGILLNGCSTSSRQKKYGGTIFSGCGIYDMKVRDGTDKTPPLGKPKLRQGSVTPWGRIGADAWGVGS